MDMLLSKLGVELIGVLRIMSRARSDSLGRILCVELGVHIGNDYGSTYDDDLIVDGGIWVGRTADPTAGNIGFTGALQSYKNSTAYTVIWFCSAQILL